MNLRNRDETRLADCEQSFRHHFGRLVRFLDHGRFLQIEPGTKGFARATQNENSLLRIGARALECRGQFG